MVQTSLKHQEKPSEYFIYSPLLHIITNRPPCTYLHTWVTVDIDNIYISMYISTHLGNGGGGGGEGGGLDALGLLVTSLAIASHRLQAH